MWTSYLQPTQWDISVDTLGPPTPTPSWDSLKRSHELLLTQSPPGTVAGQVAAPSHKQLVAQLKRSASVQSCVSTNVGSDTHKSFTSEHTSESVESSLDGDNDLLARQASLEEKACGWKERQLRLSQPSQDMRSELLDGKARFWSKDAQPVLPLTCVEPPVLAEKEAAAPAPSHRRKGGKVKAFFRRVFMCVEEGQSHSVLA